MLSREALESAVALVDRLDQNNIVLEPLAGSHLETLNKATRATSLFTVQLGNGEVMPDIENIEYIANAKSPDLGYSPHDVEMDDLTQCCIEKVRSHIAFARSVVAPNILDLVEKVSTAQKQVPSASTLLGMEVVEWKAPAPLTNPGFVESLKEYADVTFHEPRMLFSLPAKSYEEILAMMETGKSSVDDDVRLWAAGKGASFFLDLWAALFQNIVAKNQKGERSFFQMTTDSVHGIDTALAVYLIARRLVQDPIEGSGLSLTAYTDAMAEFRDQAGLRLTVTARELKRDLDAGILVRSIIGKVTTVNGEVYKDWIENGGGSNEILFGNVLATSQAYTVQDLNGNAEALTAFWNRHEVATIVNESRGKYARDMAILRSSFEAQLREIQDPVESSPNNLTAARNLFENELARVRPDDFKDLFGLCMRLVCRSRYYRTDAEFILEAGEEVTRQFPNIDRREAYAMATLEYVIRWVLAQTKARSVS